jgi:epsin
MSLQRLKLITRTLKEFVYVDDDGKDVGSNVRQKAKDITNLLQDEDRLRAERRARGARRRPWRWWRRGR